MGLVKYILFLKNNLIIMSRRFLRNSDYTNLITSRHLSQVTDNNQEVFIQSEKDAKQYMLDYLVENYTIEELYSVGENMIDYDDKITFFEGIHFWNDDKVVMALEIIKSRKVPVEVVWEEYLDATDSSEILPYSQTSDYSVGDKVEFMGTNYNCLIRHGYSFNIISLPNDPLYYSVFDTSSMTQDEIDAIEDYSYTKNDYATDDKVRFKGQIWNVDLNPNPDSLSEHVNFISGRDPRNENVVKHTSRLALYEMFKRIAPMNVSNTVKMDYEDSMMWLKDSNKLCISPLPRKKLSDGDESRDWIIKTFSSNNENNNWYY